MKKLVIGAAAVAALVAIYFAFETPSVKAVSSDVRFEYVIKYTGGASSSRKLPMLVALHGNGDTPEHFFETALDQLKVKARVVLFQGPIRQGRGYAWPWTPQDHTKFGPALREVVAKVAYKFKTVGKPVLLGFSGGGMMAYDQAYAAGDQYAVIFPVSGRLKEDDVKGREVRTDAKVIAYHGKSDRVVGIGGGKTAAKVLREAGADVEWNEVEGGHLAVFTSAKATITERVEAALAAQVAAAQE